MPRYEGTLWPDGIYRPSLYPTIIGAVARVRSLAVVDSGADRTVVPYALIQVVTGIDWDALPQAPASHGLSGPQEMRLGQVDVAWPDASDVLCSEVLVSPATIPVLLGREDFFKYFIVRFGWHRSKPWFFVDPVGKLGASLKPPKKQVKKKTSPKKVAAARRRRR